ncbi:M48 family metalloprotease [bacterium]|nr:M48 family metalloprotease [bacterium]
MKSLSEFEKQLQELIETPSGRRTFLASIPLLMVSCASTPKTRFREGDNSGQAAALTVEDERQMTQQVLPEMKKDYPKIQDAQMQSYISQLGRKVATSSQLEGNPYNYNFTVVDVGMVNAFALPAGTVFVTAPLIAMADSEAELAGVVGHEIGHIQARHTAERIYSTQKNNNSWYAIGGGILGGALGYGAGKLLCKPQDKKCLQNATLLGAGAGAGGVLLVQKYQFMANSREDEMEADRIGFRTSVRAGYDPVHVGLFYEKLLKMEEKSKSGANPVMASLADAMSTHPPSKERVQQMRELAQANPKQGVVSTDDFNLIREKARLVAKRSMKS